MSKWFVYIIESDNGHLYTGITTDLERRFKEHSYSKKGAKFFHKTKPKRIVFYEEHENRSSASKREYEIKSLARIQKLKLIKNN